MHGIDRSRYVPTSFLTFLIKPIVCNSEMGIGDFMSTTMTGRPHLLPYQGYSSMLCMSHQSTFLWQLFCHIRALIDDKNYVKEETTLKSDNFQKINSSSKNGFLQPRIAGSSVENKNVSKTIALPTVGMNVCKRLYAVVGRRSWVLMKSMLTLWCFPLKEFQA